MTHQCTATTCSGSQCERKSNTGTCWQHTLLPELKDELIPELANISYNYLSLEDLLELTNNNPTLQDELVHKFYPDIFEDLSLNIDEAAYDGKINTLKYLVKQDDFETEFLLSIIDSANKTDQAEIVEYLVNLENNSSEKDLLPDTKILVDAIRNKSLKVLKFISEGVLFTEDGIMVKRKDYYQILIHTMLENFDNDDLVKVKDTILKYCDYLTEEKIIPNNSLLLNIVNGDFVDPEVDYINLDDFIIKVLGLIPDLDLDLLNKFQNQIRKYTSSPAKEKIIEAIQILRLAKS